jgi:hypothetical protein
MDVFHTHHLWEKVAREREREGESKEEEYVDWVTASYAS